MNNIANFERQERENLFVATSHDIHLPEAMVEKDFWVCWTLDYLFHKCPWSNHFAFNGGTSLSKCFDLVERFSEDIDIICFGYPKAFDNLAIVRVIRLEIGALAAWTPTQTTQVTSYAATCYPKVFSVPSTSVLTVMAERTFWEKVTMHKEAFRINGLFPSRYSRHYYDLYRMDQTPVKDHAYANVALLDRVVSFKSRFYPAMAARYDLANPMTMRLIPPDDCLPILEVDYLHMQSMIFGEKPSFDTIMTTLRRMEREINALVKTGISVVIGISSVLLDGERASGPVFRGWQPFPRTAGDFLDSVSECGERQWLEPRPLYPKNDFIKGLPFLFPM